MASRVDALYFVLIRRERVFRDFDLLTIIVFAFPLSAPVRARAPAGGLAAISAWKFYGASFRWFHLDRVRWGAKLYFETYSPPLNSLEIHIVPSNGCGSAASGGGARRSTSCTCRQDGRSNCCSRLRLSFTIFTSRPFGIKTDVFAGAL